LTSCIARSCATRGPCGQRTSSCRQAQRHGGGAEHLDAQELDIASPALDDQLVALDEALERFAALEPEQAQLVKLRYFVGLKIGEVSELLGISEATAKRWWTYARAWLFDAIRSGRAPATHSRRAYVSSARYSCD
jgi:DNA-directed RNA polymerase specialized sigma24 family protein